MTEYPLTARRFPCGLQMLGLPGSNVEARFLYHEIFEDELYSRHGINVQDGDTVLDVGANIGMFSTYLLRKFPHLKLFAFEPVPPIFQAMQANLDALPLADTENVQLFPCGLSDACGSREITFYPTSPANSTLFPDEKFEEASVTVDAIRVRDVWKYDKLGFLGLLLFYPIRKKLIRDRMEKMYSNGITFEARFETISSTINEHHLDRIDLLKIDVEGSEFMVLDGIEDKHWEAIRQAVVEVSPKHVMRIDVLKQQFMDRGFRRVEVETMGHTGRVKDSQLACNVYATR